jgi:2-acylglycerol O-acyltransferase 2
MGCWYLNFTHNTEEKISAGLFKPESQYVIVWHPHGSFTISALFFLSHWWAKSYPMKGLFVCVADLLMRVPGLSEYLLLCNARSGSSKTFGSLLGKGHTVAIQPGGIQEQVHTDPKKETVYFPPRLGFIRLAIKHGTPLFPCYAFGENQLFPTTDRIRAVNIWLYRNFKIGTLFVLGRGGILNTPALPNPGLLPVPGNPVHLRWGEPVAVGQADDNPSEERVQEVFKAYCAALTKLFDAHKDTCLPKEVAAKGLTIVVREAEKKTK